MMNCAHTRRFHDFRGKLTFAKIIQLVTAIICCTLLLPIATAQAATSVTRTNVTFQGDGGLALHGIIVAPLAAGHYPGLVMVGGSGAATTADFNDEADAFAQRGIVTLIYDKRTVGYSNFQRDYSVLANDAIGGVTLLRSQSNVNPAMVGVFGLSEGAWVAPLAATRTDTAAFVITVGAAGGSPSQQIAWQYTEWLHHAGVTESLQHMMENATRVGAGLGLIAEADYNAVSVWRQVQQPVLALWGDFDRHDAPAANSQIIVQALQRGGNAHYTTRFIPNAQHDLHVTHDGGYDNLQGLAPGYANTVGSWVNSLTRGLSSVSVTEAPRDDVTNAPLAPLRWYESRWVLLTGFFSMLVIFGSYPIVALWRRLRRYAGATALRWPMRWLAAFGFAAVAGFFVYFAFLVSTSASDVGTVLLGNPIPWIILRLLAAAATASAAWTAVKWYQQRGEIRGGRAQVSLMLAGGALLLTWATFWGMLIL
ncbi:MAG: alpha/beta hydrolase family protein [Chloroflexota bacterium]